MQETRTVSNGGIRLAAEAFGDPEGTPLVLSMGATASMLWWPDELCYLLAAQGRYVIRYDHRDTGRSTATPPGAPDYAVEDLAADLIAVMDGFSIARADIVGMSLGAYIAQMAALTAPRRVRSLTLIGAEPLGWTGADLPGIAPAFLEHFAGFETLDWTDRKAVAAFMLEIARLCAGSGRPFDETGALRRIDAEIARAVDIRSAFNHGAVAPREDWSGAAGRIAQPALVIHGAEDPILPLPNGEALAGAIPDARLVVLDGIGHELPADVLPRIAGEIGAFLDGISR